MSPTRCATTRAWSDTSSSALPGTPTERRRGRGRRRLRVAGHECGDRGGRRPSAERRRHGDAEVRHDAGVSVVGRHLLGVPAGQQGPPDGGEPAGVRRAAAVEQRQGRVAGICAASDESGGVREGKIATIGPGAPVPATTTTTTTAAPRPSSRPGPWHRRRHPRRRPPSRPGRAPLTHDDAVTGSLSGWLIGLGLALIAAGLGLTRLSRPGMAK